MRQSFPKFVMLYLNDEFAVKVAEFDKNFVR